jgi:predicted Zn-dependent protease
MSRGLEGSAIMPSMGSQLQRIRSAAGGAIALGRVSLAAVLASALALGCALNPVTGKNQVILMSTDDEKRIDEEAALQVEAQLGLIEDPELTAYVNELGQVLAANSPRQDVRYRFHVVAMDEPNAFALPGGHIYVSRGLLALTNSEAELANVLGHEIGHVAARHAAQRDALMKAMQVLNVIGMVGAAAGGARNNGNGGPAGQPGLYTFSRRHESEADEIGQDLAVMAGIDPMGMATFMQALDAEYRLQRGYSHRTGYFDTHPAARERAAEAATAAEVRSWKATFAIAETREQYLERLENLPIGTPASEGVVKDGRFAHADLGIGLRFPPGWEVQNTRSAVIGIAPNDGAVLLLELDGEGDDPEAAAHTFAQREGAVWSESQSLDFSGMEAFRARGNIPTPIGKREAEVVWIAHEGNIYRLTGFAYRGNFNSYVGVFRNFPRGFRVLDDADRADIDEVRLRVVRAREGETLEELSQRTGNDWEVNKTAVANRLRRGELLEAGQSVKIAVRVPYRAKGLGCDTFTIDGVRDPEGRCGPEADRPAGEPESHAPEETAKNTAPEADGERVGPIARP